jgi:hypothetical protein
MSVLILCSYRTSLFSRVHKVLYRAFLTFHIDGTCLAGHSLFHLTTAVIQWLGGIHNCVHLAVIFKCRCQWPHGLRRGSAAARLLGLRVRIPPGAWKSVPCECGVSEYDHEASTMRRPWPTRAVEPKKSLHLWSPRLNFSTYMTRSAYVL